MTDTKLWDPLNKAAVLVTITTGVPAFLAFIGVPYVAAIALGFLAISSLIFALFRARSLQNRAARFLELHSADEELLKNFNAVIAHPNHAPEQRKRDVTDLIGKTLQTLRLYVVADVGCDASISMFLQDTNNRASIQSFQSTASNNFSQRKIAPENASLFSAVLSSAKPISIALSEMEKPNFVLTRKDKKLMESITSFPILVKFSSGTEQPETLGVLAVSLMKNRKLSAELQSMLLKYCHLFFLLFTSLDSTLLNNVAQPDAPGDAPQAAHP